MRKTILFAAGAIVLLAAVANSSCKNCSGGGGDNDTTVVAPEDTLDGYDFREVPQESVSISLWWGNLVFEMEGRDGFLTESDYDAGTETRTRLELVSYVLTKQGDTKTVWEREGRLVVNAYDEAGTYLGQYRGTYDSFCFAEDDHTLDEDEYSHCGATYDGMYYEASGDSTEFQFYCD